MGPPPPLHDTYRQQQGRWGKGGGRYHNDHGPTLLGELAPPAK